MAATGLSGRFRGLPLFLLTTTNYFRLLYLQVHFFFSLLLEIAANYILEVRQLRLFLSFA